MNQKSSEGLLHQTNPRERSTKVIIAGFCAAVLIVFTIVGCFLTSLIMILDAIPFHHIFGH